MLESLTHGVRDAVRRERRRPPARAIGRVIFEYAQVVPDVFFIQVGAHDGTQLDPLHDEIEARSWCGVMVEPVPYVFDRLRAHNGDNPRLILENVAIGTFDGEQEFHHLRQAEGDDVWQWYDALGSFRREVVLSHRGLIPDIDERLVTTTVPCITFDTLCERHGISHFDIVQIDTEGYDLEILRQIDLDRYRPALVMFENLHLDTASRAAALEHLARHGYEHISDGMDTLGLRSEFLARQPRLARLWRTLPVAAPSAGPTQPRRRLTQRVRGRVRHELERAVRRLGYTLTKSSPGDEARVLVDQSVPLPAGAAERLRADNGRLRELCESYAMLDLPVVRHSRWSRDFYEGWLDLRYFRGDNAYVWHYREGEEVTRLRFFVYMTYVEAIDRLRLLDRTREDGAYGCWTYRFDGHPPCSRDLLDSVCELSFLDRHLGLTGASDVRIIDIGAGYGRLAHRSIESFDGITDYCCVDAIPHSTFLAEYYLAARGVTPPGRVVALTDVQSLEPGSFDLALNVHSFSECTIGAIEWWLAQLARLDVPELFVVPNEADGFLSLEVDGTRLDYRPVIEAAGYRLSAEEPAILDANVRSLLDVHDRHCLFTRG